MNIKLLETFEKLILGLDEHNMSIGGTFALQLHGLKMSKEPGDIDVIIHKPTQRQFDMLNVMNFANIMDNNTGIDYPNAMRNYKFKKGEYFINILLVDYHIEPGVLYYKFKENFYLINSIDTTIKYKSSYTHKNVAYTRKKDAIDLQDLKNSNFNYEV